ARAILTNAPALVLEPADARCFFQLPSRKAIGDGLRGIEDLERAPENFGRRISLDKSGAFIPAGDESFGTEHEDRVVLDALDDQTVLLVGDTLTRRSACRSGNQRLLGRRGVVRRSHRTLAS